MNTELQKKLEAVANILGAVVEHSGNWGTRIYFNDFSLFTRTGGPRLSFQVTVPRDNEVYTNQHGFQTSIGVSGEKTAAQIAGDIRRRLLPDAEKYRDFINERLKEHDDYNSNLEAMKSRACDAFGMFNDSNKGSSQVTGYVDGIRSQDAIYVKIVPGRDTVNLELSHLSIEQVEAIGKVLRKK